MFFALVYVDTISANNTRQRSAFPVAWRRVTADPRDRYAIASTLHKELGLAPNQGIAFKPAGHVFCEKIDKAIATHAAAGKPLAFADAYLLCVSRLRGGRGGRS